MKKVMLSCLLFTYSIASYSVFPDINKVWYFGTSAGIDFNSSTPIALSNGQTATYDNTSAISSNQGHLLFYTDGETVWNKSHQVMVNGTGLAGNRTGGQPALIVPQPVPKGSTQKVYYIFTVPQFGNGDFRFSIVDISLDSGRGQITTKNSLLYSSTCEKLTGIYNLQDNSYWILSHELGNANFVAYKLSSGGLNITPVISNVGTIHSGGSQTGANSVMGQLMFNETGSHVVNALSYTNQIELFDFSMATGIIANPITIPNIQVAWGVGFSKSGNSLYCTGWTFSWVYQFDLTNYNSTSINASKTLVGTITNPNSSYHAGYLRLAPDNKIYIAKYGSSFLATIDSPDIIGTGCSFVDDGFDLGIGRSTAGLSNNVILPSFTTVIDEIYFSSSTVYPNPVSNQVTIATTFHLSKKTSIIVTDAIGKEIKILPAINEMKISFETLSLNDGIYSYIIIDGNQQTTGKFIKN